jgi:hypothetical protein
MLFGLGFSVVLAVVAKGICLADWGRSPDLVVALVALLLDAGALAAGPFHREIGLVGVLLIGLGQFGSPILFTYYWRRVGEDFELAKVPTTANYCLTAYVTALGLLVLVILDVLDFDMLDPISGVVRICFGAAYLIAIALYTLTLIHAVIHLRKQLVARPRVAIGTI